MVRGSSVAYRRAGRSLAMFFASFAAFSALAQVKVGEVPPPITLENESGGRVDGKAWSSSSLKGKIHTLFYVDPDEKNANEKLEAELKAAKLPADKYASVAVINMEATWLPNAAIASSLKSKQEEFPAVTYVKDLKKSLVKTWGLKDDAYVVVVFDKQGKVLYLKDGALSAAEIQQLIDLIKTHLEDTAG